MINRADTIGIAKKEKFACIITPTIKEETTLLIAPIGGGVGCSALLGRSRDRLY